MEDKISKLKQHYIIDVIIGAIFGAAVFILFFKINKAPKWDREAFWKDLHEKNPWLAKGKNKETKQQK